MKLKLLLAAMIILPLVALAGCEEKPGGQPPPPAENAVFSWQTEDVCASESGTSRLTTRCSFRVEPAFPGEVFHVQVFDESAGDERTGISLSSLLVSVGTSEITVDLTSTETLLSFINSTREGLDLTPADVVAQEVELGGLRGRAVAFSIDGNSQVYHAYLANGATTHWVRAVYRGTTEAKVLAYRNELATMLETLEW